MCGIVGYFSSEGFFGDSIELITRSLSHRGPNAQGIFKEKNVALGHTRLSILDLSEKANQPMFSHTTNYVMVYNGEVYNYKELSSELKFNQKQISFNTNSDSETVLELFSYKGLACLEHLNGMFAFAIYNRIKEEIVLVRDRIGIKPLYYYWDGKNLAFASELKALITIPTIKKEINFESIYKYFHLGFVPAPDSIYKNIYKLEPGCCLIANKAGIEIHKYWSLEANLQTETINDEKQAIVILSDLIASSVQFQLRSDVPFGVFLSGGIDSSLITAQAARFSGTTINTFSIGFEENKFDESKFAFAIAKYLGTNHHQFIVTFKDVFNLIEGLPAIYDEPFADSSALPTLLVSKLAKQHVTVTLSGEGGDELFMGYGIYKWANRLDNALVKLIKPVAVWGFKKLNSRYKRVAELFNYDTFSFSHLFSQEQYLFSSKELKNLLDNETNNYKSFLNSLLIKNEYVLGFRKINKRILALSELQSIFDLKTYLPDDLLTKVDRASMYYGLETRVPYLDHRIVAFALNLNHKLKIKNGVQKYLLKEVLYQYVPKEYFNRPKQGFSIPLSKWMNNELVPLINDYLNESVIKSQGIFNYQAIQQLIKNYRQGDNYLYNRLWLLLMFQLWYYKCYNR